MLRRVAASFLLPFLCVTGALADSYIPLSIPELIEAAHLVVVGEARERDGRFVITAEEVLKGPVQDEFAAQAQFGMGRTAFGNGSKGVFCLRRARDDVYSPFHPGCLIGMNQLDHVKALFSIAEDPGPYTDLTRHPENADYVYFIGSVFAGYRISSDEVPQLAEKMQNFSRRYYQAAPWAERGTVDLRCSYVPGRTPELVVESASSGGRLAEYFSSRMRTAAKWSYVRPLLKPRFTVTLDTRWPPRVGSLSSEKAVGFLRARLGSRDSRVVRAAFLALAKMRDLKSVPKAVELLRHENMTVAMDAMRFLEWSRDRRATAPLCRILDEAGSAGAGDRYDHLLGPCIHALMEMCDPASAPSIERLVDRGLGCGWASNALGRAGRKQSFDVLLKRAETDVSRNMSCLSGLYWLVRRSNLPVEPWMANPVLSGKVAREKLPKWRDWWEAHRNEFRITSSYEEALRQQ